jgi:type IV pilus assembly protein PilE
MSRARPSGEHHRLLGFTLLELLLVLALIGTLLGLAQSGYRNHLVRGQVTDGERGLLQAAIDLEWCLLQGLVADACPLPAYSPLGHFALELDATHWPEYRLRATAEHGSVSRSACAQLTLRRNESVLPVNCR